MAFVYFKLFLIFQIIFFLLVFMVGYGYGEKILAVTFWSTQSHRITYQPFLEELAKRGNEITVLSPVPEGVPVKNIREIFTFNTDHLTSKYIPNIFEQKERKEIDIPPHFAGMQEEICSQTLDLPHVKELRKENFDLIILQIVFNECAAGYVYTFNTTTMIFIPIAAPSFTASLYGNPSPPSIVPNVVTSYTDRMNFYQRTVNFIIECGFRLVSDFFYKPPLERIYREKLNNSNIPPSDDIVKNTSLILCNSHFTLSRARPFLPNIIEVGGLHCRPAKPLPKDLEDFVNSSAADGFILFSMGSALKGSQMSQEKRKIFLGAFSKIKQKVLWKWETETMPDLPKNVKLSKWLPQQDLLGHPKIRAFITHGGFGGSTEAVYHGVPLIGIPIFIDQGLNMAQSEQNGYALTLEFNELSEEKLVEAINRIIHDPTYNKNVKTFSKIFRDQPTKPLDLAVFWTEYVIRHKGAPHLKSSARNLNFIQYHSLDVIGFLLATVSAILWLVYSLLRFIAQTLLRFMFSLPSSKLKKSQKKQ